MANVNNRITSTKQVWIVVHEDHYFKHLFYDMALKYSYVGSDMVGVKITFHDQYQQPAHEIDVDLTKPHDGEKQFLEHVFEIFSEVHRYLIYKQRSIELKQVCLHSNKDIFHQEAFKQIEANIILAANKIAAYDSKDQEQDSKFARIERAKNNYLKLKGDFESNEILYIKFKSSVFDNNLILDNRDEEYLSKQKTSFGSEAKAKEILGVEKLQDPLVKARSTKPEDKTLLDIKDLTFTGDEEFVDENMPKCIRYPILKAMRKTDMTSHGLNQVSLFQVGIPEINACRGKAIDEFRSPTFIYNAILELCDVVRPKDLIVYKWSNGLIVLQIGSWLVNAEYNSGIVVYGDDHKQYKLGLLMTRYLSDKALRWDEYYDVELPNKEGVYKPVFNADNEVSETIKLEVMTGTEFICKCGKPKDIKMCFAIDES